MAQYVFTMNRVGKIVPPKRQILKDVSLSFFPGAKIGVLGVNGSGKSTLLKIMAGLDKDIEGEEIRLFYNDHPALQERINYLSSYLGARADKITPQMELNRETAAYFSMSGRTYTPCGQRFHACEMGIALDTPKARAS